MRAGLYCLAEYNAIREARRKPHAGSRMPYTVGCRAACRIASVGLPVRAFLYLRGCLS
jgi:hypothetical protein